MLYVSINNKEEIELTTRRRKDKIKENKAINDDKHRTCLFP